MLDKTSEMRDLARRSRNRRWRGYAFSWLMILPAMAFLVLFVIYPVINMGNMSLYRGNATNPYK